ncbi:MAG TPA: electron transfer flavoprotein subunit alpha/FixB family protein, partial [Polyangiaceae bacterium]
MTQILVIAELSEGHARKSTHSAIAFAKQTTLPFSILVLGSNVAGAAKELEAFGAQKILVADDASLDHVLAERYAPTVAAVAQGF